MSATLDDYIFDCRKMLKGDVHQGIRDLQIIKLMIWKDGPKDKIKAKQLIEKLRQWQKEADDTDTCQFYMTEIEAYEILLSYLK